VAFEEGVQEAVCFSCGAVHDLRWSRMPVREEACVRCLACRTILVRANTVRDYYEVRLAHRE